MDAWTRRTGGSRRSRRAGPPRSVGPARPDPAEPAEVDHEAVARKILLDQLTGRARSRHELADKLRGRLVPDDVADRLLDRFEEIGLIDDAAFARAWVSERHRSKGLAPRALTQELRRKGIDDETVRAAVEEVSDDDQESAARALVRRKMRTLGQADRATATRRLAGMLARKGYPPGLCFKVVKDELGAELTEEF